MIVMGERVRNWPHHELLVHEQWMRDAEPAVSKVRRGWMGCHDKRGANA